jgi:intein/homing endonuclease
MGVNPARDPGPGKTDSGISKKESTNNKAEKGKAIRLVPSVKESAPKKYVGSRTLDRAELGPGRIEKISDLAILNQSGGKSVLPACAACLNQVKHS